MSEEAVSVDTKKRKPRAGRSPAYPSLSVDKALDYAKLLLDQEGDYEAPLGSAMSAWGYSPKSSGGRQALATLKYYGLIDVTGEGDGRKIAVSEVGRRILRDEREDQTEKRSLISQVALTPNAHKLLYGKYPNGLPSDSTVTHMLHFDEGFTQDGAKELLAEYKRTAEVTNLYQPEKSLDKSDETDDSTGEENDPPSVKVGDKVQWTLGGQDQFATPATVLEITEDGQWVFTDQGQAAAAIEDITVIEAATPTKTPPPVPAHILAAQSADQMPSLGAGQTILSQGKLKAGAFEVRVTGEVGAREIGKIIKLLQAQQAILSDDDEIEDD